MVKYSPALGSLSPLPGWPRLEEDWGARRDRVSREHTGWWGQGLGQRGTRDSEGKEVGTRQRTGSVAGGLELLGPVGIGCGGLRWAWLLTPSPPHSASFAPACLSHEIIIRRSVSLRLGTALHACGAPPCPPTCLPWLVSGASLGLSKPSGQSAGARIQTQPRLRQQQCGHLLWPLPE